MLMFYELKSICMNISSTYYNKHTKSELCNYNIIEFRLLRWVGHIECTRNMQNTYRILFRKFSSEYFTLETYYKQDDNTDALYLFRFLYLLLFLIFYNLFPFTSLWSLSCLFFFPWTSIFYRPILFLMFIFFLFSRARSIHDKVLILTKPIPRFEVIYIFEPRPPPRKWKIVSEKPSVCVYALLSMNLRLATARTNEWVLLILGI
jgi:hypothetical protein